MKRYPKHQAAIRAFIRSDVRRAFILKDLEKKNAKHRRKK